MLAHASHQLFKRSRYSVGGWGFVGGGYTPTLLSPLAVAPRTRSLCSLAPRSWRLWLRPIIWSFANASLPGAGSLRSLGTLAPLHPPRCAVLSHRSLRSPRPPSGGRLLVHSQRLSFFLPRSSFLAGRFSPSGLIYSCSLLVLFLLVSSSASAYIIVTASEL